MTVEFRYVLITEPINQKFVLAVVNVLLLGLVIAKLVIPV